MNPMKIALTISLVVSLLAGSAIAISAPVTTGTIVFEVASGVWCAAALVWRFLAGRRARPQQRV